MVKRCVQRHTGLEFAAKIINTKKLSARGELPHFILDNQLKVKLRIYYELIKCETCDYIFFSKQTHKKTQIIGGYFDWQLGRIRILSTNLKECSFFLNS